jgi:hypothetical protein
MVVRRERSICLEIVLCYVKCHQMTLLMQQKTLMNMMMYSTSHPVPLGGCPQGFGVFSPSRACRRGVVPADVEKSGTERRIKTMCEATQIGSADVSNFKRALWSEIGCSSTLPLGLVLDCFLYSLPLTDPPPRGSDLGRNANDDILGTNGGPGFPDCLIKTCWFLCV